MASTFLSLHYHVVFSTKNRSPLISDSWKSALHEYIGGTINGLGGASEVVGGVADHVHLLFGLRAAHCLADVIRDVKKAATNWAHDVIKCEDFYWQNGYAAFTVSPTARDSVRRYIENQEDHHRQKSFREELKELLTRAGIEFEEKYLD